MTLDGVYCPKSAGSYESKVVANSLNKPCVDADGC